MYQLIKEDGKIFVANDDPVNFTKVQIKREVIAENIVNHLNFQKPIQIMTFVNIEDYEFSWVLEEKHKQGYNMIHINSAFEAAKEGFHLMYTCVLVKE